jgi:hypothetical protein
MWLYGSLERDYGSLMRKGNAGIHINNIYGLLKDDAPLPCVQSAE